MRYTNSIKVIAEYINECSTHPELQSQHLSGAGDVFHLEEKIRKLYNKKFVLTFCNATIAMYTVCIALELQNDEIITSPVNWGGSLAPFLFHRNNIRFSAIDLISLNLDENNLSSSISYKSKAVLSVDYGGTPVNSRAIKEFCQNNDLTYISDSAQSFGSYRDDRPSGYFADVIIISFSSGKAFFAGEGGAVITDNANIYEKLIWYSQHPSKQKAIFGISNYNEYAPINGRINPLSAIFLNESFGTHFDILKRSQVNYYELYQQLLNNDLIESNPDIISPNSSTFYNFSVQLKSGVSIQGLTDFIRGLKLTYNAFPYSIKLIPFDESFKKQFKGRFSCTLKLRQQANIIRSETRITLKQSL